MGFTCQPSNVWHHVKNRYLLVAQLVLCAIYWVCLCIFLGNDNWIRSKEYPLVPIATEKSEFVSRIGLEDWSMDGYSVGIPIHYHGHVSDLAAVESQPIIERAKSARLAPIVFIALSISISILLQLFIIVVIMSPLYTYFSRIVIIISNVVLIVLAHLTWMSYIISMQVGVSHDGWSYGAPFAMSVVWHIFPSLMLPLSVLDAFWAHYFIIKRGLRREKMKRNRLVLDEVEEVAGEFSGGFEPPSTQNTLGSTGESTLVVSTQTRHEDEPAVELPETDYTPREDYADYADYDGDGEFERGRDDVIPSPGHDDDDDPEYSDQ